MRLKGFNTMTRYIDDDTVGAARFAMQASNIAKRMGTVGYLVQQILLVVVDTVH